MEPRFLSEDHILAIHRRGIEAYGGQLGLRDSGGFDSAINAPRNIYSYNSEADLFDLAAAYAYHIAEAQAFYDGNKRAGLASAAIFLQLNGILLPEEANDRLAEALFEVAAKSCSRKSLASLLRELAETA